MGPPEDDDVPVFRYFRTRAAHVVALRAFIVFALLQAFNFLLITVNYRAVAHVQYVWAALTDGVICLLSWTLLKKIASAEGWSARIGYACGGMGGSLLGMWMTRVWG